jgi:hypothetical protein
MRTSLSAILSAVAVAVLLASPAMARNYYAPSYGYYGSYYAPSYGYRSYYGGYGSYGPYAPSAPTPRYGPSGDFQTGSRG